MDKVKYMIQFMKGKAKIHTLRGYDFEGEYLNGKIWKGNFKRAHDCNREIIWFKGEYKDGIIWNAQGYDPLGNKDFEIKNGKGIFKKYKKINKNVVKAYFEGEYNNGNINGKVIAYGDNDEKFEGYYLNGKKSGFCKEYDNKGNLRFEGNYLNGKRNGKGKEYDKKRKIIYEGEYTNGERDIKVKKENIFILWKSICLYDIFEEFY